MKTTNFFKQIPGLVLISGALIFTSCDGNNERGTLEDENTDNIETITEGEADAYEMTDRDYENRRERANTNLNTEIERTNKEVENLRQRAETATEDERNELHQQIDRLESRRGILEEQQGRLENSTIDNWEETEREVETTIQDRDGTYENFQRGEDPLDEGYEHGEGLSPELENEVPTERKTVTD